MPQNFFTILILIFICQVVSGLPAMRPLMLEESEEKPKMSKREKVAVFDRIVRVNKEANVDAFEGDIVLTEKDFEIVNLRDYGDVDGPLHSKSKRAAKRARQALWKSREIPYEIDQVLIDHGFLPNIMAAIQEYSINTCLRWIPKRPNDKNWVRMIKGQGCKSHVGMEYWREGFQNLSLGSGCNEKGTIMHEMMHALGFWHEQSRPDRNKYVEVFWENIESDEEDNFNKYSHSLVDLLKLNYDYDSIMHYGRYSFSVNKNPTIQVVGDPNREIGQRNTFTAIDKMKLDILYDCKSAAGGWSAWSLFGPCDTSCDKYRQRFCISADKSVCAGADNYGIQTSYAKCSREECYAPVAGHWGRWSSWSSCSSTCGKGRKIRKRNCDDPPPKNGGANCVGTASRVGECTVRSCFIGLDDCEFDGDGFCHWVQDKTDTSPVDWERIKGSTPTGNTGPSADHTSGTGFYLYFEASSPSSKGSTARLISKSFPAVKNRCLSFWYHLYGGGMGTLNVYLQSLDSNKINKAFTVSGNQGDVWKQASVGISSFTTYKVIFEGVRGADYRSDIALDDIKFRDMSCPSAVETPISQTPAPTTPPLQVKALQFPRPLAIENYVLINGLQTEISQLTLCIWAQTDDKSKNERSLFSYAHGGRHNELLIYRPSSLRFYLHSGNWRTDYQNVSVAINDGLWHHLCLTWENLNGDWAFYKDGKPVKFGSKLKRGHVIPKDGIVVLGQEQDAPGGKFNKEEAFPGSLAQINMWNRVFSAKDISKFASSCNMGGEGNALSWQNVLKSPRNGIVKENVASCSRT